MRRLVRALPAIAAARRYRWAVIGAWLLLAALALPLQGPLTVVAADESETFQVRGSESAVANRLVDEAFRTGSETAAVIAYHRPGGLTDDDGRRADRDARQLCESGAIPSLTLVGTPYQLACGQVDPLSMSPGRSLLMSGDQEVILATALMTDESTPAVEQAVRAIRDVVPPPNGDATGLRAFVTGPAGFDADASDAVKGINEILLAVTVGILLVLLLAIYRSPLIALVPLVVVALAYLVAGGLVYGLYAAGLTTVSGQTTAILVVLMFGAGTDYCLLLVARFRDELRRGAGDDAAAVAEASRRTGPAILSAGATTALAMLVLAVADFNATREMGPLLAVGVIVMVAAGLTLLPAILATLGRRAFWPFIPRPAPSAPAPAFWRRVATLVVDRPRVTAVAVLVLLVGGALGNVGGREPLDFTDAFRDPPDSVLGQELIAEHFSPGRVAPIRVVAPFDRAGDVVSALTGDPALRIEEMHAVAGSLPGRAGPPDAAAGQASGHPLERSEHVLLDGYLAIDPFSAEATELIPAIRARARRTVGAEQVVVGGPVSEQHDALQALACDTRLVVPVALLLVLLILAAMLRALVLPAVAIATVVLSFGFALGLGSLVFTHLMGQPASDPYMPLFAFVFLVGLGVDYNVFLLARIREERQRGTVAAVREAVARTGGVITSAGLVLAATFSTLMALPMEAMFQVGFVIAAGLLADTFLVRALLLPSLVVLLGERGWWPSRHPASVPGPPVEGPPLAARVWQDRPPLRSGVTGGP